MCVSVCVCEIKNTNNLPMYLYNIIFYKEFII